jgi:hypothetical protein
VRANCGMGETCAIATCLTRLIPGKMRISHVRGIKGISFGYCIITPIPVKKGGIGGEGLLCRRDRQGHFLQEPMRGIQKPVAGVACGIAALPHSEKRQNLPRPGVDNRDVSLEA